MNNPKIKYLIKFISVWLILTFLFIVGFGIIMSLNPNIGLDSKDFPIIIASCLIACLIVSPLCCKVVDVISSSIGIKKSELLLTENISKSRKTLISCPILYYAGLYPKFATLFITEAGVEVYSGKHALDKTNFYILWKDIDNIGARGGKLIIKSTNGKTQKFIIFECSAEMIEDTCTKYRDQIKDTGAENL